MPTSNTPTIDPSKLSTSETITPDGVPIQPVTPTPQPAPSKVETVEPPKTEVTKPIETSTEDDKTINFSDFLTAKNLPVVEDHKPPVEEKKDEVPPKPSTVPDPNARDYSDLAEEDKPLFKNMSNDAFNKLKPVYLEHKRLKTEIEEQKKAVEELKKSRIPDSYYDNPDAFVLTPEFREVSSEVENAQMIYTHWLRQLKEIKEGAKEFDYLDFDRESNQYVISKKVPVDSMSETELMSYVNYGQNLLMQAKGKAEVLRRTHVQRFVDSTTALQEIDKTYFAGFEKPENKPIYDPLIRQQLGQFPSAFRSNPIAILAAKAIVMNHVLAKLIDKIKAETGAGNGAQVSQKSVSNPANNPTAGEVAGEGGNKSATAEVSFDDFQKAKRGGY